jgi:hypothetical protein
MGSYTPEAEHFAANPGEDVYDTWFGAEVRYGSGYIAGVTQVTGGSYDLSGPGAGDVTVVTGLGETGIHGDPALEPDWPGGDYGYHVHLQQPAGAAAFNIEVTVDYQP